MPDSQRDTFRWAVSFGNPSMMPSCCWVNPAEIRAAFIRSQFTIFITLLSLIALPGPLANRTWQIHQRRGIIKMDRDGSIGLGLSLFVLVASVVITGGFFDFSYRMNRDLYRDGYTYKNHVASFYREGTPLLSMAVGSFFIFPPFFAFCIFNLEKTTAKYRRKEREEINRLLVFSCKGLDGILFPHFINSTPIILKKWKWVFLKTANKTTSAFLLHFYYTLRAW